jgi:hypothetical protein
MASFTPVGSRIRVVFLACLAMAWWSATPTAWADAQTIVYPRSQDNADLRGDYYVKLLDLALSKTRGPYELRPSKLHLVTARWLRQLEANDGVNVIWSPTSREMERRLLPIRLALDKGVLGWRLFLIRANDRHLFEGLRSLEDLQQYTAGLQRDWGDVDILRANGIRVEPVTNTA